MEPFSFIRTITVGFGVAPNLLTPMAPIRNNPEGHRALAGLGMAPSPPVGTFTPP
jgi:hypothetical protein